MGHYILVEKDAKCMQTCWSSLIIGVLSTIIVTCFLSTNGYSAVLRSFNYNCVSGATITFKNISTDMDAYQSAEMKNRIDARNRATHDLSQEFHSYYLPKIEQNPDNGTTAKTQTDQFLKKESATNHTTTTERSSILQESTNNLTKDIKVFENYEIDEINTQWGKEECCSLFYYYPIVEITVAFVWITLIMISGPRPRPLIHKSWRLVIPSLICFILVFIFSAIYAAYLNTRLNSYCDELGAPFTNNELPCNFLINRFLLNNDTLLMASTNFYLVKIVAYVRTILWLVVVLVMLLRCILHADFNVEELEQRNGSAADGDADSVSRVKFIVRKNSRDLVYKPTTQLQIDG